MLLGWDDPTKISFFQQELSYEVQKGLTYYINPLEIFNNFMQLSIKINNRLQPLEKGPKESLSSSQPKPASTSCGTQPSPMNLSITNCTSRKRDPISNALHRYRRNNKLCLYSGTEEHFTSNCLHSKKKKLGTAAPAPTSNTALAFVPSSVLAVAHIIVEKPKN